MKKVSYLFLAVVSFIFMACNESENEGAVGSKGAYILNEGLGSSTLSIYNTDSAKVFNDIFQAANGGATVGSYAQSIAIRNGKAYVVVTSGDGNGYVEVIDMNGFKSITQIDKFSYPREICIVSNERGFISNGNGLAGVDDIYEFDLRNNSVSDTIRVGGGPEKMLVVGNRLYVANSGGWANDGNTISVIDLKSNEVIETISVSNCPVDMDVDKNNNVWVFCNGDANWTTFIRENLGLVKINTSNYTTTEIPIGNKGGDGIKNLAVSKDGAYVYYVNGGLYRMSIDAASVPADKFLTDASYKDVSFYGIDVDPRTGDIFCLNSTSYVANGELVIFDKEGAYKATHEVGIIPNSAVFNY